MDLLRKMSKPKNKNNGVIFNIDITGKIQDTNVGNFALILKILIGSDIYSNQIQIFGCQDVNANNCQNKAHYSLLIGTLEIAKLNYLNVASLDIRKKTADLATVKLNDNNAVDIKFFPNDRSKIFILIKGCDDNQCTNTNDFYVGGIYSQICKINYFNLN